MYGKSHAFCLNRQWLCHEGQEAGDQQITSVTIRPLNPICCPAAPCELTHCLFTWLYKSLAHPIISLKIIWQPVIIVKKNNPKTTTNKNAFGLMPEWGAPRGCWSGRGEQWNENSCPEHGESPCKFWDSDRSLPDGRTAVVALVVSVVILNDRPFGSTLQHFFFSCSVCGPEDGKQAGSMFSRGPEGELDLREEFLPKCHVCLAWQRQCHTPFIIQVLFKRMNFVSNKGQWNTTSWRQSHSLHSHIRSWHVLTK